MNSLFFLITCSLDVTNKSDNEKSGVDHYGVKILSLSLTFM